MTQWLNTNFTGVRYREHPTRKNGVGRDRYFAIRFQQDGKRKEEGLGWASEGWTAQKAALTLAELKKAATLGEGPQRLSERRELDRQKRSSDEIKNLTFGKFFEETYFPWVKENKAENTIRTEKLLYDRWVSPVLVNVPLLLVSPVAIERIKKFMSDGGKAPKTIHHTLALIRQVFNFAKQRGFFSGDHPVSKVKMPVVDNAKLRYLTPEEVGKLLAALKEKSIQVHDQALLAVNCGLRFSEATGIHWQDVNFESQTLSIRDAKTGSRIVFLNDAVEDMLKRRQVENSKGLVFPDENGKRQAKASKTFWRVANDLFNKDVKDRRLRVSFHTLRHTFGSLLYQATGDLYLTQKALGHRTLIMAQRYAKMSETRLREAFVEMGKVIKTAQGGDISLEAKSGNMN